VFHPPGTNPSTWAKVKALPGGAWNAAVANRMAPLNPYNWLVGGGLSVLGRHGGPIPLDQTPAEFATGTPGGAWQPGTRGPAPLPLPQAQLPHGVTEAHVTEELPGVMKDLGAEQLPPNRVRAIAATRAYVKLLKAEEAKRLAEQAKGGRP
jgi:hypothetical protein